MYMKHIRLSGYPLLALIVAAPTWAQPAPANSPPTGQPTVAPSREVPRPDQLEPGVDTSAAPAGTPGAGQSAGPSAAPARKTSPASARPATTQQAKEPAQDKGDAGRAPLRTGAAGKAQDRIELDTTQITGNRELPKVLYIVPWKRSDLGDLVGKPVNSLLDEVLAPVDRDVFKRENRYYDALKPDQGHGPAASVPSAAPGAGRATAPGSGPAGGTGPEPGAAAAPQAGEKH